MRKFTENQPLLASVRANNVEEIKGILIDNIFFLQGEKNEINKAVEYALNDSDFKFEEHRVLSISNKENKKDIFSDEKWNLSENFSRDRYNLLVELYSETFAKQEYTYESDTPSKKNEIVTKVVVGGAIIIVGFLIYKSLN
ncbi:MAG: hypothetical protein R3353_00895 [Salegentibacter mishustinae]|nr:hypothetical protein [Salegentibacter mishustinae]